MSLSESGLFTPVFDQVLQRHGVITALIYGLVWRYCQMSDRVCKASVETLSARLKLSRITIVRHLDILIAAGLLTDRTPTLRNRPHIYIVNRPPIDQDEKDDLSPAGVAQHQSGVSESDTSPEGGVSERYTSPEAGISEVGSTVSESHDRDIRKISPTLSQRYLNQTLLRDKSDEDELRDMPHNPKSNSLESPTLDSPLSFAQLPNSPIADSRLSALDSRPLPSPSSLWNFLTGELARQMGKADYVTWVQPARALDWDGATLQVGVANAYARDWLSARVEAFCRRILQALVNDPEARLVFVVE